MSASRDTLASCANITIHTYTHIWDHLPVSVRGSFSVTRDKEKIPNKSAF